MHGNSSVISILPASNRTSENVFCHCKQKRHKRRVVLCHLISDSNTMIRENDVLFVRTRVQHLSIAAPVTWRLFAWAPLIFVAIFIWILLGFQWTQGIRSSFIIKMGILNEWKVSQSKFCWSEPLKLICICFGQSKNDRCQNDHIYALIQKRISFKYSHCTSMKTDTILLWLNARTSTNFLIFHQLIQIFNLQSKKYKW